MRLWSNNFEEGKPIPDKCAYRKDNVSPHLSWDDVPSGTKSFALICNDPDAPVGNWIHWTVYDIPADVREILEGGKVPGVEGMNDYDKEGWGGPAPPSGTHRYFFTLYALNVESLSDVSKDKFRNLCEEHKIASAKTMGTYSK